MALHWDLTKCADSKALCDGDEWPITNAIIWSTIPIGLYKITAENLDEWIVRTAAYEKVCGAVLRNGEEPVPMRREWLAARIGLECNTFPGKTRRKFCADLGRYAVEDAERDIALAKEPAK